MNRTFEENKELKDSNKSLRDINEQLPREIEKLKNDREAMKKQFDNLIDEKKKDNEARKARKTDKQKYMELIKKTMLHKVAPELAPAPLLERDRPMQTEEPITECSGKQVNTRQKRPDEPMKKPKIKAFVEFEKQKSAYYTHYIAHPCPYCMPSYYGCPIHGTSHAEHQRLSETELETTRKLLQSPNEGDKEKGLRTLFFHAQDDPKSKQFIEEKYPGMDVEGIIKGQNYMEFATQLSQLMSTFQKAPVNTAPPEIQHPKP